jgi:hypothetical protein
VSECHRSLPGRRCQTPVRQGAASLKQCIRVSDTNRGESVFSRLVSDTRQHLFQSCRYLVWVSDTWHRTARRVIAGCRGSLPGRRCQTPVRQGAASLKQCIRVSDTNRGESVFSRLVSDTRQHLFKPCRHLVWVSDTWHRTARRVIAGCRGSLPGRRCQTPVRQGVASLKQCIRVSDTNRGESVFSRLVSDTRQHLFKPRRHLVWVSDTWHRTARRVIAGCRGSLPGRRCQTPVRQGVAGLKQCIGVSDTNRGESVFSRLVSDTRQHLFQSCRYLVWVSDTWHRTARRIIAGCRRSLPGRRCQTPVRQGAASLKQCIRVSDTNRGESVFSRLVSDTRQHLFKPCRYLVWVSDTWHRTARRVIAGCRGSLPGRRCQTPVRQGAASLKQCIRVSDT